MEITTQFIASIIKKISQANITNNDTTLQLAKDLYWARHVVAWRLTEYKGFSTFCNTELPLNYDIVRNHVRAITMVKKYKYTDEQCISILKHMSWSSFVLGLSDMNRKLSVKKFIKTYKNLRRNPTRFEPPTDGDRAYIVSLPAEYADILDIHLINYGMTFHATRRRGVRDAMIELINRKLK